LRAPASLYSTYESSPPPPPLLFLFLLLLPLLLLLLLLLLLRPQRNRLAYLDRDSRGSWMFVVFEKCLPKKVSSIAALY